MTTIEKQVQSQLFEMQDINYRDFHARLMPNIDKENIIGVRTPNLRSFAKEFAKTPGAAEFLKILPHKYYEENNLHGILIEQIKDYDTCISALDEFLPYVDNWATCDLMRPRVFNKYLDELMIKIKEWLRSGDTYTVRFGIEMLMTFYLDKQFRPEYLGIAAELRSDEYYINMMIAWFFATALAKQYDAAVLYIEHHCLNKFTHNKAIQKSIESYRISDEQKKYLRSLKTY